MPRIIIQSCVLALALMTFSALPAMARDRSLLKKAVENSNQERAGIEQDYKSEGQSARATDGNEMRAIHVEIGDELGPESDGADSSFVVSNTDHVYREKGGSKKLEREWKEVNRGKYRDHDSSLSVSGKSSRTRKTKNSSDDAQ